MAKRTAKVYQFKITLQDIRPPVWRRIQVPATYTFWDLHVAIQDVMGWEDLHLHSFEMKNPGTNKMEEIGIPEEGFPIGVTLRTEWKTKISRYFTMENKKALYWYDFGDDWRHTVALEKILPSVEGIRYPRCIAGRRATPPEDCGGPYGYYELLAAIENPSDETHEEKLEWLGGSFDPGHFSISEIRFSDPRKRLKMAHDLFDEEANEEKDEDGGGKTGKKNYSKLVKDFRAFLKEGNIDELDAEERRVVRIFADHEVLLKKSDRDHRKFKSSEELIVHISMHEDVEKEIDAKEPIETYRFYEAMLAQNQNHHEIVHMIGAIKMPIALDAFLNQKDFDTARYRNLLGTCAATKIEKIPEAVSRELFKNM